MEQRLCSFRRILVHSEPHVVLVVEDKLAAYMPEIWSWADLGREASAIISTEYGNFFSRIREIGDWFGL
jgi:hypothetical protein